MPHSLIVRKIHRHFFVLSVILMTVSACSIKPPVAFYNTVKKLNYSRHQVQGGEFKMVYYGKQLSQRMDHLHVYLGGDGIPWIDNWIRSND